MKQFCEAPPKEHITQQAARFFAVSFLPGGVLLGGRFLSRSVSLKKRFEIFKRDGFKCQYCGNTPPAVVLELDHVHPVSKGGDSSPENLLASCFDCNRGKRDSELNQIIPTIEEKIKLQKEKKKQLDAYNKFLLKERSLFEREIEEIGRYWFNKIEKEKDVHVFDDSRKVSVKTFLKKIPKLQLFDFIDLAFSKLPVYRGNDNSTFKYFCGICWNTIRNIEDENAD